MALFSQHQSSTGTGNRFEFCVMLNEFHSLLTMRKKRHAAQRSVEESFNEPSLNLRRVSGPRTEQLRRLCTCTLCAAAYARSGNEAAFSRVAHARRPSARAGKETPGKVWHSASSKHTHKARLQNRARSTRAGIAQQIWDPTGSAFVLETSPRGLPRSCVLNTLRPF